MTLLSWSSEQHAWSYIERMRRRFLALSRNLFLLHSVKEHVTGRRVRDVRPFSIPGSFFFVLCRGGDKSTIGKAKKREPGIGLTCGISGFFNSFL